MIPMGNLTDTEIAGLISYLRAGAKVKPIEVMPHTISALRNKLKPRKSMFTLDELMKLDHNIFSSQKLPQSTLSEFQISLPFGELYTGQFTDGKSDTFYKNKRTFKENDSLNFNLRSPYHVSELRFTFKNDFEPDAIQLNIQPIIPHPFVPPVHGIKEGHDLVFKFEPAQSIHFMKLKVPNQNFSLQDISISGQLNYNQKP